ncbi:MAG: flagellar biosynthesis protein FlhB [Gammaproteobacteria bacterium]|nr:MAG: flagellar biosynthesis protein FlhB [Gammaproteobacteria bacterium]
MADSKGQERTEQPTAKRLRDAREKGQVARSRELSTMMVLLAGSGGILILGHSLGQGLQDLMRSGLALSPETIMDPDMMLRLFIQNIWEVFTLFAPLLLVLIVAALLTPMAMSGWNFSTKTLAFKWEKLDPIKGIGRIFSIKGVVELLKALAKFLIIDAVALIILWLLGDQFLELGRQDVTAGLGHLSQLLMWSFVALSASMVFIVTVDVPFQLWDHSKKLRMTRQEVKDELKETEGNPEMRARIRRMQQEAAQQRMMSDVPDADVVITNPEHYSVALKYNQDKMAAPIVVAKGVDLVAMEIRRVAQAHHVMLVAAPPLARAVYYSTKINSAVPSGLYIAVAQVLAYVYQLKQQLKAGKKVRPRPMADLPIPDELKR